VGSGEQGLGYRYSNQTQHQQGGRTYLVHEARASGTAGQQTAQSPLGARAHHARAAEQKDIAIEFSAAHDIQPELIGDPLRLGQVLINLVNNAIKFTQAGRVAVDVSAEGVTKNTTWLRFAVSDTGIGMNAEQISNLFQSFNQADASHTRKFGGTGLGLAISKQLCDLMGGTLIVESEPGKGSTFIFRAEFPISPEPVEDAGGEESPVFKKGSRETGMQFNRPAATLGDGMPPQVWRADVFCWWKITS
jgi:hypothetical protein